jgi:hypothetical protein
MVLACPEIRPRKYVPREADQSGEQHHDGHAGVELAVNGCEETSKRGEAAVAMAANDISRRQPFRIA